MDGGDMNLEHTLEKLKWYERPEITKAIMKIIMSVNITIRFLNNK